MLLIYIYIGCYYFFLKNARTRKSNAGANNVAPRFKHTCVKYVEAVCIVSAKHANTFSIAFTVGKPHKHIRRTQAISKYLFASTLVMEFLFVLKAFTKQFVLNSFQD